MSARFGQFFGTSAALSDSRNLPKGEGRMYQDFPGNVRKVVLGRMLAQVSIIPMATSTITLIGYSGDEQMLRAVSGRVDDSGTLKLEGEIPFKPGGSRNHFGGGIVIGSNVTITSGGSYSSFSSGDGDTIVIDGREVDLDRTIRLALIIPSTVNVKIGKLIGPVGITDRLDAELNFSSSMRAELMAHGVKSLIGDISGSGQASVTSVTEDADLEVSGSGQIAIGTVSGSVEAKISGSGTVTVNGGTSSKLRSSVSGSGKIFHYGTVMGDARLRVTGSGNITASQVRGEVDPSVTGSGWITANGVTYRPRRGGW